MLGDNNDMDTTSRLLLGLDGFADQFRAQIDNAGPPGSEHAVHFCLALRFQAAYDLPSGSIVFERPVSQGRIDLWIIPLDVTIELKYQRPHASGATRAATMHCGSLLADFNKLMYAEAPNGSLCS